MWDVIDIQIFKNFVEIQGTPEVFENFSLESYQMGNPRPIIHLVCASYKITFHSPHWCPLHCAYYRLSLTETLYLILTTFNPVQPAGEGM